MPDKKILLFFILLTVFSATFIPDIIYTQELNKKFKIGLAVLKNNPDYHTTTAFVNSREKQKYIDFQSLGTISTKEALLVISLWEM